MVKLRVLVLVTEVDVKEDVVDTDIVIADVVMSEPSLELQSATPSAQPRALPWERQPKEQHTARPSAKQSRQTPG